MRSRRSLSLTSIRDVLTTNFPRRALSTTSGASAGAPSEAQALVEPVWKGTLADARELNDRGYKNFLEETLYTLHCNKKRPSDVLHVVNVNEGRVGTWAEFVVLSDWEYHSGYGVKTIVVNTNLIILGDDWWLKRGEYDGSSWWEFVTYPALPTPAIKGLSMKAVWS